MRWKVITLLSFAFLLLVGCSTIEWTGVYSRFIGRYDKYDDAINGLTSKVKGEKNEIKKMGYLILIGVAYQKKGLLSESMKYYEESLMINNTFNYFALLQKAQIYKIEGNIGQEQNNLKLTVNCINNLKKVIENKSMSENDIMLYKVLDHCIGYNIYKEDRVPLFWGGNEQQRKTYLSCLDKRINEINGVIDSIGNRHMRPIYEDK